MIDANYGDFAIIPDIKHYNAINITVQLYSGTCLLINTVWFVSIFTTGVVQTDIGKIIML